MTCGIVRPANFDRIMTFVCELPGRHRASCAPGKQITPPPLFLPAFPPGSLRNWVAISHAIFNDCWPTAARPVGSRMVTDGCTISRVDKYILYQDLIYAVILIALKRSY